MVTKPGGSGELSYSDGADSIMIWWISSVYFFQLRDTLV